MRPISSISKQAWVSILGALGRGASGTPASNDLAQINTGGPIGPATSVHWDSSAFISNTGKVLVVGIATASKAGGTLAAGDLVTFELIRDFAGTPVVISAAQRVGAVTTGADVTANCVCSFVDQVTPGVSHTYSIQAAVSGGHTAEFAMSEATILVIDI